MSACPGRITLQTFVFDVLCMCCFIFVHGLLFMDLTWGRVCVLFFFFFFFENILLLSEKSLEICLYLWQRSVVLSWPFVLDHTLKTGYCNQWTLLPLLLLLLTFLNIFSSSSTHEESIDQEAILPRSFQPAHVRSDEAMAVPSEIPMRVPPGV